MSFRIFIYYCAVLGAWAALGVWAMSQAQFIQSMTRAIVQTSLIAAVLGLLMGATLGGLDAVLNASGKERANRIAVSAGIGLVGGLLGGLLGQFLADRAAYLRTVGWVLVGVAIGGSIGIYDLMIARGKSLAPWKKVLNGVLGGFLGGLVGGMLSGLMPNVFQSMLRTSAALGFILLGACIGLSIGLAQVILKEAWLKVEAGFRSGRELMLTKDETTVGRAESCDLGMFGDNTIERLHARIKASNNGYIVEDAGTPAGTFVNDQRVARATPLRNGDVIRIGNSILRFGERAKARK